MSKKCKAYSASTDGSEPIGYKEGFYAGWESREDEVKKLKRENRWLTVLIGIIRDKAELKYNGNKGMLAFSDLKDEANRFLL
jgi:hypothetical protein